MPTCTEVDISDLTEFEFATSCDAENCDNEASAIYSKSHSLEGCWGPVVNMCQTCLTQSLRTYETWLSVVGQCAICKKGVHGGISQNTRIVRL